uniref:Uncharacterized protein n=1 Tax=Rhizoctonia solani TaxID=456999 RepID=N0ACX1_9AGAM|nr:hypothetical protein RSOL_m01230 [Rhizoctonia solani]AGK45435.1 hypothetical protein RSOL_m01230 [Rhizoctonia solani]
MIFLCVNLYGPYSFSCMVLNKFRICVYYINYMPLLSVRTWSGQAIMCRRSTSSVHPPFYMIGGWTFSFCKAKWKSSWKPAGVSSIFSRWNVGNRNRFRFPTGGLHSYFTANLELRSVAILYAPH